MTEFQSALENAGNTHQIHEKVEDSDQIGHKEKYRPRIPCVGWHHNVRITETVKEESRYKWKLTFRDFISTCKSNGVLLGRCQQNEERNKRVVKSLEERITDIMSKQKMTQESKNDNEEKEKEQHIDSWGEAL